YLAAFGRVLRGIDEHVRHALPEPHFVDADVDRFERLGHRQAVPLAADQRLRRLDRELDAAAYVCDFALEIDATLGDPRDVQQIVEQSPEVYGLALDDADQRLLILVRHQPRQQFRSSRDRRDRIAQLVREHGEEFVLEAIALLQCSLQATLLGNVQYRADHGVLARREQGDDQIA